MHYILYYNTPVLQLVFIFAINYIFWEGGTTANGQLAEVEILLDKWPFTFFCSNSQEVQITNWCGVQIPLIIAKMKAVQITRYTFPFIMRKGK